MMNESGVTTRDMMRALCNEMELLQNKRITFARANASARLAMGVIGLANLEIVHHKLRPSRGASVRPVTLAHGRVIDMPAIEDKSKKRKK